MPLPPSIPDSALPHPERPVSLAELRARAAELGLDVGAALAVPGEEGGRYRRWVAEGFAGAMDYMVRTLEVRADPRVLLPGARSVVVVAFPYGDGQRRDQPPPGSARIARYARSKEYHGVLLDRVRKLRRIFEDPEARAFVDTGPVLEKAWAQRAGLGWMGKHTHLVSRNLGSWFHLGVIVTRREVEASPPHADHCGRCTRCLDACPTGAIRPDRPFRLDARLCISYLTIELRGPIPEADRPLLGEWVFGCDLCVEACPWNRFAVAARDHRLSAEAVAPDWSPEALLDLDSGAFEATFRGTPVKRTGRAGLLRNAAVVLGNRRDPSAVPRLARVLWGEPEALVRGHAAWALGRIGGADARSALRAAAVAEADPEARREVLGALGEGGLSSP